MKGIIFLLAILISSSIAVPAERTAYTIPSSIGQLPEMVVTAERFEEEDEGWIGMLDTVVVTAPRVRVVTGRTADKSSAGQNRLFAGVIFLSALSLSILSWFLYQHYLARRRRLQDCPC